MKLYHGNAVDTATLTASSERSGFPASNVQHPHLSRVWRSLTSVGQYIIVDAGVGNKIAASAIAVLAHNLTVSAVVTVWGSDTDSWAGGAWMDGTWLPLTWLDGSWLTADAQYSIDASFDPAFLGIAEAEYRFWRFDFYDPTNPDGYIEVGRLWLSETLEILPAMLVNFEVALRTSDVTSHSITRQRFTDIGTSWREFTLEFPPTEYTLVEQLRAMYENGRYKSLIMACVDVDDWALIRPCYCSLMGDGLTMRHHSRTKWTYEMSFEEDH